MDLIQSHHSIGIETRMRRSRGRSGRVIPASTKVTRGEQEELEAAAKREGKSLSEWAREVLLREARTARTETALFTEVVALRMLTSTVLRSIALGQTVTPESYAQVLAEVRTGKHEAARDLLSQYQHPTGEQ